MISTSCIEKLLGPPKAHLMREIGQAVDHREILNVIHLGETVRIRQLHCRLQISENFLLECLKRLTKESYLSLKKGRFAGNDCHFYTRIK